MPKKQQRNAFYFFMKDLEPQLRREGRVFPNGMADVVPIAHPRWKTLPAKDKERFENMAKEFKAKMRGVEGDKYRMDTKGQIIAYRKNETEEMNNYFMKMAKEVKALWPPGQGVIDESFFLINFQILCETEEGQILPVEMACVEFSLKRGIIKTFHKFLDPGDIPTGYAYTCMRNSELTHQIPHENFERAEADYSWISAQLKNFVNPNEEKDVYPALYCRPSVYKETRKSLEWLHIRAMDRGRSRLSRLLSLEGLVMDLYEHMGESKGIYQAVDILSTTSYDFVPNHSCKFHEEIECKYCSLGILNRYIYSILSELAVLYEYELTPRHLPERVEHDIAVTVIPPPKDSIFPQPVVNRGQRSSSGLACGGNTGAGTFASRDFRYPQLSQTSDSDDQDQDDDSEWTTVRIPQRIGMAGASDLRSRPPGGMGLGLTKPMDNSSPSAGSFAAAATYNGRESMSSQGNVIRPGLGLTAGVPFGRGMRPPGPSNAPRNSPLVTRPGLSSVLGPLPSQIRVPVGRGYAPPSMTGSVSDRLSRIGINNQ